MKDKKNDLASKGLNVTVPSMEVFPTAYKGYKVTIRIPEYTSLCPKTGLPDFGVLTLTYEPQKWCVELKSFKYYIHAYRNIGIFYENAVNKILQDFVKVCRPKWATLKGEFTPRGGISTTVEAGYKRSL